MAALLKILVVDKDDDARDVILRTLPLKDCELSFATTAEEAYSMLGSASFTAAMIGTPVEGSTIESFLARAAQIDPLCELFVVTDHYDEDIAVKLITSGAFDVIPKPLSVKDLKKALFPFLMHKSQSDQVGELEREARRLYQYQGMVGKNPQMLEIYSLIERVGRHFKTALITGETGTGKGLVADALHRIHGSTPESFVYCNCPALSASDLREMLFETNSDNYVVSKARGGTLFLDEIGELSADAQNVLLEAIEHGDFLCGDNNATTGTRIIAASARPLKEMTASGTFRTELLARLSAVEITLPALRDRSDDIPLLAVQILENLRNEGKKSGNDIERQSLIALMKYRWPGNIRELEHVLERACVMTDEDQLTLKDLPPQVRGALEGPDKDENESTLNLPNSLEDVERIHIAQVLKKADFNKVKASRMLGISRSTLYQKMAKYQLQDPTRQGAGAATETVQEPGEPAEVL